MRRFHGFSQSLQLNLPSKQFGFCKAHSTVNTVINICVTYHRKPR